MLLKLVKYSIAVSCFPAFLFGQVSSADSTTSKSDSGQNQNKTDTSISGTTNQNPIVIGEIYISGNRKTRSYIIERELPFKRGDSIFLSDLIRGFAFAKE